MGWNATRAVDGNRDQDGTYGSCAWAHNNDDVFKTWWNVDLGAMYDVQSIEAFFRTDGKNVEHISYSQTVVVVVVVEFIERQNFFEINVKIQHKVLWLVYTYLFKLDCKLTFDFNTETKQY